MNLREVIEEELHGKIPDEVYGVAFRQPVVDSLLLAIKSHLVPEKKEMTGSLGYQGQLMGIKGYEMPDEAGWNACRQEVIKRIGE